jgi:transcriptional regulator with XRE-family HTH domain
MKQVELAMKLGISRSYLSMMLSGQRKIPFHLQKPLSELVHKKGIQEVPSKQVVAGSSPVSRSTQLGDCLPRLRGQSWREAGGDNLPR